METIYWGPSGWRFLHLITFLYPEVPDTGDKILMQEFMNLLPDILPCKYCRASFNKYYASLDLIPHLESRELLVLWLYKMHNKVNKKLRAQGFCHHDNPSLEYIQRLYAPRITKVHHLLDSPSSSTSNGINKAIHYICSEGREFLGSIIFNYQGYFTNCHTSDEKSKISHTYHRFFNIIIPLLKRLLHPERNYKLEPVKKYRIRGMLQQTQSYSRLKRWFYECRDLCRLEDEMTYEKYEKVFNKHIVAGCNISESVKDGVKSCRKYTRKDSSGRNARNARNKKTRKFSKK
jgi:hypothetical protein